MRNSTSVLSLVLALGIYGAGPIVTKFGPFAATAALADSEDSGSDSDDSGDDTADGADDDSSALQGADDDLGDDGLCTVNCKVTIKKN